VLCFALVLPFQGLAHAQTDPDELARRHFESGAAYFEQAEYEAALREFGKAYELSQRPQILRNISVVEERLGNIAAAIAALDEYLESAPNDPDVDTIRIRRDNLRKRLEQEQSTEPVPMVEPEQPAKKAPEPKPEPLESNDVEFNSDDFPPEADDEPNLVPAFVLITLGGLAAVGSAVTGVLANNEHETLKSSCGANTGGCSDEQVAQGETLALTSTVLTGVAVLGVGIGAIWWATADSGEGTAKGPSPDLFVGVGPEGGYGRARWTF
jgi:tetratricopeptide (TPR) repeat protein